jgi:hypothetical protein
MVCGDVARRSTLPSCVVNCVHTSRVNGQSKQRCVGVLGADLHKGQIGSCWPLGFCVVGESKQRSCI